MRAVFEKVVEGLFKFCGSIMIILLIILFLFKEGMEVVQQFGS